MYMSWVPQWYKTIFIDDDEYNINMREDGRMDITLFKMHNRLYNTNTHTHILFDGIFIAQRQTLNTATSVEYMHLFGNYLCVYIFVGVCVRMFFWFMKKKNE